MPEAGTWALQFQVAQNFTLGSFQGSTISLERHLSEQSAWRAGVTVGGGFSQSEQESFEELPSGESGEEVRVRESTSESNDQSLTLSVQYLRYALTERDIVLFYGAGPTVGASRSSNSSEQEQEQRENVIRTERESSGTSFSAGASGVIGGEWFVRSNLSLSAEYRSTVEYRRSESERRRVTVQNVPGRLPRREVNEDERSSSGFELRADRVRFGVSIYF